jgi:protein-disulfide isomerase
MRNIWVNIKSVVETTALVAVAAGIWYTAAKSGVAASPRGGGNAGSARSAPSPKPPTEPISLDGAEVSGKPDAKVALVVYSDFQCPYCGQFARNTLPTIQKQYVDSGKVLLAFRELPLDIHPFAQKAAEGALCAGRQGKFWLFHDALFGDQQALDTPSLRGHAARLGLNAKAFDECLGGQTAATVAADRRNAESFEISGTPTFFVGTIVAPGRVKVADRFSGALPIAQFQTRIDELLRMAGVSPSAL